MWNYCAGILGSTWKCIVRTICQEDSFKCLKSGIFFPYTKRAEREKVCLFILTKSLVLIYILLCTSIFKHFRGFQNSPAGMDIHAIDRKILNLIVTRTSLYSSSVPSPSIRSLQCSESTWAAFNWISSVVLTAEPCCFKTQRRKGKQKENVVDRRVPL